MLAAEFDSIVAKLDQMSLAQIQRLGREVNERARRKEVLATLEARVADGPACVYCSRRRLIRWGTGQTGLQRWRCKDCGRTFNSAHGTAMSRARRPDLFLLFIKNMLGRPWSCREAAAHLGIHPMTAWRWRMKVCAAIETIGATSLGGVVEADETFQRESRKGSREWVRHQTNPAAAPQPPRLQWHEHRRSELPMMRGLSRWQIPILTLADRSGARRADIVPGLSFAHIGRVLTRHIAPDSVLCSDKAQAYKKFAATTGVRHVTVAARKGQRIKDRTFHIQNVNALHSRFKDFIRDFDGPNTANLKRYVSWFVYRETAGLGDESARALFRRLIAPG